MRTFRVRYERKQYDERPTRCVEETILAEDEEEAEYLCRKKTGIEDFEILCEIVNP